jgi:hypothetical protein
VAVGVAVDVGMTVEVAVGRRTTGVLVNVPGPTVAVGECVAKGVKVATRVGVGERSPTRSD